MNEINQVVDKVWDKVRIKVKDPFNNQVWTEVWTKVRDKVSSQVWHKVYTPLKRI